MRTKPILTALCAVAAASVCFGGEMRYVLVDGVVVAEGAPPAVVAVPVAAPRTRVVMVKECTVDEFGRQTCRMVPRTEYVDAPASSAAPVATVSASVVAACPCVAATGSCPCSGGVTGATYATQAYAFPHLHAARLTPMPHPVRSFIHAVFSRFRR